MKLPMPTGSLTAPAQGRAFRLRGVGPAVPLSRSVLPCRRGAGRPAGGGLLARPRQPALQRLGAVGVCLHRAGLSGTAPGDRVHHGRQLRLIPNLHSTPTQGDRQCLAGSARLPGLAGPVLDAPGWRGVERADQCWPSRLSQPDPARARGRDAVRSAALLGIGVTTDPRSG